MRGVRRRWLRWRALGCEIVGARSRALGAWRRLAEDAPADDLAHAAIGHLLCAGGRHADALPWLTAASRIAPSSALHAFNLGFALQACARDDDALEAFDDAIRLDARFDRAHYGRALSLIRLGHDEAAIPALQAAIALQPMSPFGWYQLAHVQHRLGQVAQVRATIAKLATFEPGVARHCAREIGLAPSG